MRKLQNITTEQSKGYTRKIVKVKERLEKTSSLWVGFPVDELIKEYEAQDDWTVVRVKAGGNINKEICAHILEEKDYEEKNAANEDSQDVIFSYALWQKLKEYKEEGKKLLVYTPNIQSNQYSIRFAGDYQIFARLNFPVFWILSGEGFEKLKKKKGVLFLNWMPKIR